MQNSVSHPILADTDSQTLISLAKNLWSLHGYNEWGMGNILAPYSHTLHRELNRECTGAVFLKFIYLFIFNGQSSLNHTTLVSTSACCCCCVLFCIPISRMENGQFSSGKANPSRSYVWNAFWRKEDEKVSTGVEWTLRDYSPTLCFKDRKPEVKRNPAILP